MRVWLILGTAVEILLVVVVLAVYLVKIGRSLRRTADYLAKVTFGVRAIDKQLAPVGSRIHAINSQLEAIAGLLPRLIEAADGSRAATSGGRRSRR